MTIVKIYKIACDNCQTELEHAYSLQEAVEKLAEAGWITKPKVGHFCTTACAREFAKELKS